MRGLKLIRNILLLPILLVLGIICLVIHAVAYAICIAGSIIKAVFAMFALVAFGFGLWTNSLVIISVVGATFILIVFICFVDVALQEICRKIGRVIIDN